MTNRLKGKVALVTGGTGSIGVAIGKLYITEGARVVLADAKESKAEKDLVSKNSKASFQKLDVTSESQWKKVISKIVTDLDYLDILVNGAGTWPKNKSVDKESLEDWQKVIKVDLTGSFLGIKSVMGVMKKKGGSIIDISSVEGKVANPKRAAYCAAKGGVVSLTKAAALDATQNNYPIRVNNVLPGIIKTPLTQDMDLKSIQSYEPVGHLGSPKDIGEICVYLGSDESKYATGTDFIVDGGYTVQ